MRRFLATVTSCFAILSAAGCSTPRAMQLCRVVDIADHSPIAGARVWAQPFAPIHPFWPAGDKGTTDEIGIAQLNLPTGYWWHFSGVSASGYKSAKEPPYEQQIHEAFVFYMRRDYPRDGK